MNSRLTLRYLLTLKVVVNFCFHDILRHFFFNGCNHIFKHRKTFHLVFAKRICLAVRTKVDTLAKLIHCINMIHPFRINCSKNNNFFKFTHLFFRELLFFFIITSFCMIYQQFYHFFRLFTAKIFFCDFTFLKNISIYVINNRL